MIDTLPAVAWARSRLGVRLSTPWLVLCASAGVAVASLAEGLSRSGRPGATPLFWGATILILVPATLRMAQTRVRHGERAATLVLVGLALYAIKVLRDPFSFTFADEFPHFHNLQAILSSGRLFGGNSILPITPRYPGVESVAAAVARLAGTSPFVSGLITIAAARMMLMLALYLFYARVSGSPRAAGLGVLVYTATPTFLLWSAQFSYESLALPLATVGVFALVRWQSAPDGAARARWMAVLVLVVVGVVPTHHITAYALLAFLAGTCLLHLLMRQRPGAPLAIAAVTAALAIGWLALAASGTIAYLRPVVNTALAKVLATINGQASTRVLFANQGGAEQTPTAERLIAVAGILVLVAGVAAGIWAVRRQRRASPVLVLLMLASAAYVLTLPLRFVPAAWETASRAGEFLFVGVGLVVALGIVEYILRPGRLPRLRPALAAAAVMFVFASGVIAGWPASLRLAQPLRVRAGGHTLQPPSYVAAAWSGATLGPAQRVAAEDSDARLFLDIGHQTAFSGVFPDVDAVLSDRPPLKAWQRTLLRRNKITLVETDRRKVSTDVIGGYFFDVGSPALSSAAAAAKFDLPGASRIYDSGNIVIYWVRGLW